MCKTALSVILRRKNPTTNFPNKSCYTFATEHLLLDINSLNYLHLSRMPFAIYMAHINIFSIFHPIWRICPCPLMPIIRGLYSCNKLRKVWPDFHELTVLEDLGYSANWLHRQGAAKKTLKVVSINILIIENAVFFSIFFSHSRCWTSQTPTARPTVRRHSSIRKTRGSTRRGWRPSWSRAGWTSELLLVSIYSFLSIALSSSSSQYFSRSFLPHQEKKTATISEKLKCHPEKMEE